MDQDGAQVLRANDIISSSSEPSQDLTLKLLHIGTPDQADPVQIITGDKEENIEGAELGSAGGDSDSIFATSVAENDNHILVDHIEADRVKVC